MMRRREPLLGGALCFSAPSKGWKAFESVPFSPLSVCPSLGCAGPFCRVPHSFWLAGREWRAAC